LVIGLPGENCQCLVKTGFRDAGPEFALKYFHDIPGMIVKIIKSVALCLCTALALPIAWADKGGRMDENDLARRIESTFADVRASQADKSRAYEIHVEKLAMLILVAERHARGSKRLDELFTQMQKETPRIGVPRHIMTPTELEKLIDAMAFSDTGDLAYSAYQRKVRPLAELIDEAKTAITRRSGFQFDPSAPVVRAQ